MSTVATNSIVDELISWCKNSRAKISINGTEYQYDKLKNEDVQSIVAEYIDDCLNSKKDIIKAFDGDLYYQLHFKIKDNVEINDLIIDSKDFKELYNAIKMYLQNTELKKSPYLKSAKFFSEVIFNKKKILEFKKDIQYEVRENKLSQFSAESVNSLIQACTELHGQYKAKANEFYIYITCNPKDFAKLGHYDCDRASCFRNDAGNYYFKYNLANCKNSFIVLFSDSQIYNLDTHEKINFRCFGTFDSDKNVVYTTNYYSQGNKCASTGEICLALKEVAKIFIPDSDLKIVETNIPCGEFVYTNMGKFFSYAKDRKNIKPTVDTFGI